MSRPLVSPLISNQLPGFFKVDHPTFVSFLEAYYEFLEQDNPKTPTDFADIQDMDQTLDTFIEDFRVQYLADFPESLVLDEKTGNPVNKRKLIKNIDQFYRSKGTPKAVKFLIRVLLDTNVDIYEPSRDVFRLSDGKYIQNKSIRTTSTQGSSLFDSPGKELIQRDSSGTITTRAKVQTVNFFDTSAGKISEFFIKDINGSGFQANSPVEFVNNEGSTIIEKEILSVITSVTPDKNNAGQNYEVGDKVIFETVSGDKGQSVAASVGSIGSSGEIRTINIDNFGFNYEKNPNITKVESVFGSGGVTGITTTIGSLCEYPGYYSSNDGVLSTNKKVQDNKFYQNFSYVIRTEATIDKYRDALLKIAHPAGFGFFGQVRFIRCAESELPNHNLAFVIRNKLVGNFSAYTNNTKDNLNDWFRTSVDGATQGYDPAFHDRAITTESGAVNDQFGTPLTGNPISASLFFEEYGASPDPLSGPNFGDFAEPFYIIESHPNVELDQKVVNGRVSTTFKNQVYNESNPDGSTGWKEFQRVYGPNGEPGLSNGADGWFNAFTGDNAFVSLKYFRGETEMRKIFIRSLIEGAGLTPTFDCRRSDGYSTT